MDINKVYLGDCLEIMPSIPDKSIEKVCEIRKALGLFDDRVERIERALRYQEFINGQK